MVVPREKLRVRIGPPAQPQKPLQAQLLSNLSRFSERKSGTQLLALGGQRPRLSGSKAPPLHSLPSNTALLYGSSDAHGMGRSKARACPWATAYWLSVLIPPPATPVGTPRLGRWLVYSSVKRIHVVRDRCVPGNQTWFPAQGPFQSLEWL